MRYDIKISDRDIQKLFEKVFNLKIVASSIVGFRNQLKREAASLYGELLEMLKKGDFIHADETGWKIDGHNYWLWKFSNKKICVSHIDKGRGQKVVEEILGKEYGGVLISDFLSAYNKIITKAKQRCLVHLIRDLKKVVKYWKDDREIMRYCKRLREILEDGMFLHKEYRGRKWDKRFCARREIIVKSLQDFSFPDPSKRILQRFANRLKRHKDEIFTFLYVKGIDFHNNHAEQQIRPDVIFRKITFGNRSLAGAEVHKVLVSILQTVKLNHLNPIKVFEKILLATDKNQLIDFVLPP